MNTFGNIFRVSVFGESHGESVGVVIDGCPPGIKISLEDIMSDLDRRRSGAPGTTKRKEYDQPIVISGSYKGYTTGAPIVIITKNSDTRPEDYNQLRTKPRPGHADMVSHIKYKGFADQRGGGHFSGRLTWGLVAAGYFAKKIVDDYKVEARIIEVGGDQDIDGAIEKALIAGDSIGGIIECRVKSVAAGLGEPFFMSAESVISQAVFSVPAIKGIEFGAGFRAASMRGSEHNDMIINSDGSTSSNNSGGINGGITNGNDIVFRVAVKPTSSISLGQKTYDIESDKMEELVIKGRHDVCIALRIPVIIESVTAIALADLLMINRGING
jgi:chorismate synthase